MKAKKLLVILAVIALVAIFAVGLVACNNKDTRPVVTVGYTLYEPMNYMEGNKLVGFDTELATKVFEDLGYRVVFKEISWDYKYVDLNSGNIACIWNGFTSDGEDDGTPRNELVDFSYNYMRNYQTVVVKSANAAQYTSLDSFNGKSGCVESGSAGEEYADKNMTGFSKKTATTQMAAIREVFAGTSDFAVVDFLLANSIVGKGDFSSLQFLPDFNSDEEFYGIGFKKGSDLTARVNATLEKFLDNGTLQDLADKYNLTYALVTDYSSQQ